MNALAFLIKVICLLPVVGAAAFVIIAVILVIVLAGLWFLSKCDFSK